MPALTPHVRYVQFTRALPAWQHQRLGAWLAAHRHADLRFYGNYQGEVADLEFLRCYGDLGGFDIDSVYGHVPDLAGLRYLPSNLQRLTLGIPSSQEGEVLLRRTKGLERLALSRHRRLPTALRELQSVRTLYVEGPVKDLSLLSALTAVEDLTLRSVTAPDLSALVPMRSLTSLDIKLGGTQDLSLLPQLGPLTYLELWLVRGLHDLSMLGDVTTLERLKLESLRQVTHLPDLSRLTRLRSVEIGNLKGLRDFSALATAPALEHIWIWDAGHLKPEDLRPLVGHPSLKSARIGLGSKRKNDAVRALLQLPEA